MKRKVLMIGYPAWETSREAPAPARSPVSQAGRILAQAKTNSLRAKRADTHARLATELGGI